jgi:hypothetical protein
MRSRNLSFAKLLLIKFYSTHVKISHKIHSKKLCVIKVHTLARNCSPVWDTPPPHCCFHFGRAKCICRFLCIVHKEGPAMIFFVRKSIIQKNPRLIPLSQVRTCLRWANPLIANPQIVVINQLTKLCTAHPLQIATLVYLKTVQKLFLFHELFKLVKIWIRTIKVSWGRFKSVKRSAKCNWVRKLQICKLSYLRRFHFSINFWKFANLWILQFMELRHTHNVPISRGGAPTVKCCWIH